MVGKQRRRRENTTAAWRRTRGRRGRPEQAGRAGWRRRELGIRAVEDKQEAAGAAVDEGGGGRAVREGGVAGGSRARAGVGVEAGKKDGGRQRADEVGPEEQRPASCRRVGAEPGKVRRWRAGRARPAARVEREVEGGRRVRPGGA